MLKFYKYLKRVGTVASAIRQIVLTVLLVCSIGHDVSMVDSGQMAVRDVIIKI
jgi:hypothetical protein